MWDTCGIHVGPSWDPLGTAVGSPWGRCELVVGIIDLPFLFGLIFLLVLMRPRCRLRRRTSGPGQDIKLPSGFTNAPAHSFSQAAYVSAFMPCNTIHLRTGEGKKFATPTTTACMLFHLRHAPLYPLFQCWLQSFVLSCRSAGPQCQH